MSCVIGDCMLFSVKIKKGLHLWYCSQFLGAGGGMGLGLHWVTSDIT